MRIVKEAAERKKEILDAMIARVLDETIRKAEKIALDESVPVLERLTKTVLPMLSRK